MHLCWEQGKQHCGWHENLIINPKPKVQHSAVAQEKKFCLFRLSMRDFKQISWHASCALNRQVFGTHNKETSDFNSTEFKFVHFLLVFLENLKPKLIPYYPITSMKLNVDDSIKDNFLFSSRNLLSLLFWLSWAACVKFSWNILLKVLSRHTLHLASYIDEWRSTSIQSECGFWAVILRIFLNIGKIVQFLKLRN